ncbi:hypothetical protein [Streptomyces pinistramenti]|uniref:hypothetical protein n=1 Tax=Streptomyces pinistramenti TaxID=2884812 RepID=UPI001D08BD5C|nr:hypothetical protein [Streptomyces pinistramenti]MCB5905879.1 hypothetical protein [Streptomyces pinistramenti]
MTSTDTLTRRKREPATTVLSRPALIRLVSEIDDNGPVQDRRISGTFADLPRHQVRQALTEGQDLGVLRIAKRAGNPHYLLTPAGAELADSYDAMARWARTHHFPDPRSDFLTRTRACCALLSRPHVSDVLLQDTTAPATGEGPEAVGWAALAEGGLAERADDGRWYLNGAGQQAREPLAALASWVRRHAPLSTRTRGGRR